MGFQAVGRLTIHFKDGEQKTFTPLEEDNLGNIYHPPYCQGGGASVPNTPPRRGYAPSRGFNVQNPPPRKLR